MHPLTIPGYRLELLDLTRSKPTIGEHQDESHEAQSRKQAPIKTT
jgi:hypothetical protein